KLLFTPTIGRRSSRSTLLPYTTLFRSQNVSVEESGAAAPEGDGDQKLLLSTLPFRQAGQKPVRPFVHPRPTYLHVTSLYRRRQRSEEHTSELQSPDHLVCHPPLGTRKT